MEEKVLILFSGGLDSLLATCKIIEEGYKAVLVHYDNGCMLGIHNVSETASRIIERYGKDKVEFWGIGLTVGYFYSLKNIFFTKNFSELTNDYPTFVPQQLYCLTCRTAMYIYSILLCKQLKIKKIAEGARKSQLFAIEQEEMLEEYKKLLSSFGIELLLPVFDLKSDYEREELLLIRGIMSKVKESQCQLGTPMHEALTSDEISDVVKFFNQELLGPTLRLIKDGEKIPLDNRGKAF